LPVRQGTASQTLRLHLSDVSPPASRPQEQVSPGIMNIALKFD
jgi:hypothetical protein